MADPTENDPGTLLEMLIVLGREWWMYSRDPGYNAPQAGDLVVEINLWKIDPDGIGWLMFHGDAPYNEDGTGEQREVWDVVPLSWGYGVKPNPKQALQGFQRWENAEFVALPPKLKTMADALIKTNTVAW